MKLESQPRKKNICFRWNYLAFSFNFYRPMILISALLLSCQSKNLNSGSIKSSNTAVQSPSGIGSQDLSIDPTELEQKSRTLPSGATIIQSGKMVDLSLSEDETKLIYAASDRRAHSTFQIYSLDLNNFRERRLTFNDGQNSKPLLIGNSDLLYSSTTDSIKERPLLFYKDQSIIPSNIYLSDTEKGDVERLTRDSSQDAVIPGSQFKGQVLVTRKPLEASSSSQFQVINLNLKNDLETKIGSLAALNNLLSFSASDKMWYWIFSLNQSNILRSAKDLNPKTSFQEFSIPFQKVLSLQSIRNSKLLLTVENSVAVSAGDPNSTKNSDSGAKPLQDQKFYVLLLDSDKKCVQKILQSVQPIESPQLTSDYKRLYYIRHETNLSAIMVKQLQVSNSPCEAL